MNIACLLAMTNARASHWGKSQKINRLHRKPASGAGEQPLLPDDKANKVCADFAGHTRPHPPPQEEYGPHPTAFSGPGSSVSPTSAEAAYASDPDYGAEQHTRPGYRYGIRRRHHDRAKKPAHVDIPDRNAISTHAHNRPNRTFSAEGQESQGGTSGRSSFHRKRSQAEPILRPSNGAAVFALHPSRPRIRPGQRKQAFDLQSNSTLSTRGPIAQSVRAEDS